MQLLVHALMLLAEVLFFIGLAGSAVVIVLAFSEDVQEISASDEPTPPSAVQPGHR